MSLPLFIGKDFCNIGPFFFFSFSLYILFLPVFICEEGVGRGVLFYFIFFGMHLLVFWECTCVCSVLDLLLNKMLNFLFFLPFASIINFDIHRCSLQHHIAEVKSFTRLKPYEVFKTQPDLQTLKLCTNY